MIDHPHSVLHLAWSFSVPCSVVGFVPKFCWRDRHTDKQFFLGGGGGGG